MSLVIGHTTRRQYGFTIVEVILFLAISGLMMAGLLVAVSGGINSERYRDATNSFTDFLKEQYNLVDNVQNAREASAALDECGGGASIAGTSANCTIIGRYIATDATGRMLTSLPVIAENDIVAVLDGVDEGDDERDVYGAMGLVAPRIDELTREYTLRWQTSIVSPGESSDATQPFRMVLLRSPLSGTISTYVVNGTRSSANVMEVISGSSSSPTYLCVNPDGLTSFSQKTGVSVDPLGVNSSAVQFATAGECRGE